MGVLLVILSIWSCSGDNLPRCRRPRGLQPRHGPVRYGLQYHWQCQRGVPHRQRQSGTHSLEDITLEDAGDSPFRINVDGIPGPSVGGLELDEGDSLYVFVEVTIDPENDYDLPFIVEDRIRVTVNGFSQYVQLLAMGSGRFFHGSPGGISTLDCNSIVDRAETACHLWRRRGGGRVRLNIESGANVHVHAGGGIYVSAAACST